ncbi:MAG: LysR family transcriptional regulator [Enterocloster sp.]
MTLLQLKYVVTVAAAGTISEAAKQLFMTQPSLTSAIKELEQELGITIFNRTNKGVVLSSEGEEFLGYARQVIEQTKLIEEKYFGAVPVKHQFCVSTQHYSFAVEAFVELLEKYGGEEYDFRIRETQTYEIIEDVARLKSEVGVLYLNSFNETVLRKTLRENDLKFQRLFIAKPHVFVSVSSPLAKKPAVMLEDLDPYPRLSYEQGEHNSFYFSEEILSTRESRKDIMVSDRATLFNLLIGLNGYTICSGVINEDLNGKNIVAVPLEVDDYMEIGYITHNKIIPGKFASLYIEALKRYTEKSNCSGPKGDLP